MPLVPALRRQSQAELCEFEVSLVYKLTHKTSQKRGELALSSYMLGKPFTTAVEVHPKAKFEFSYFRRESLSSQNFKIIVFATGQYQCPLLCLGSAYSRREFWVEAPITLRSLCQGKAPSVVGLLTCDLFAYFLSLRSLSLLPGGNYSSQRKRSHSVQ
ncbi:hypothetical protein STEG23_021890 [Scotinomys teguina]